jgi:hypothetical protein
MVQFMPRFFLVVSIAVRKPAEESQRETREQRKEPDCGYNVHHRSAHSAENQPGVKVANHNVRADLGTIQGAIGRGKPSAGDIAIFEVQASAVVEGDSCGSNQHEIQSCSQAEIEMKAADGTQGVAAKAHMAATMNLKMNFIFKLSV